MRNFLIFLLIALCFSCSRGKVVSTDIAIIPLARFVNKYAAEKNSNNIVKDYRIIHMETSDSILISDSFRIHEITDNFIILSDNGSVYFFDLTDGHFLHKFNKTGNGPGEYLSINNLILDVDYTKIYIHDINKRTIHVFSLEGKPLIQYRNDSIADLAMNKEEQFIVSYYPSERRQYYVGVYDKNWENIISYIRAQSTRNVSLGIDIVPTIKHYNGYPHTYINDTLFRLSMEGVLPVLIIDKGALRLPIEIASDTRRKDERHSYIWGDYGFWSGSYYFLSFYYNKKAYYDVWNTSSRKLLCRNVISFPDGTMGFPFVLEGKTIFASPKFVKNNKLYCTLDFDQAYIICPQYNMNNNPLILEITL